MKLYLAIILLLSSIATFSQTEDQDLLKLLDSVKAIDPIESLNSQLIELDLQKTQANIDLFALRQDYNMLLEFYVRQDLYRKIVDQLELGINPDQSELEPFNSSPGRVKELYLGNWSLVQIPPAGSTLPITIYIDSSLGGNPYFWYYPTKDFGLALSKEDAMLKKVYPKVFDMIKNGKIIFQYKPLAPQIVMAMHLPGLHFPSDLSNNSNKSLKSKQKYADVLLDWISNDLSHAMESIDPSRDVLGDYMKIEKKAYKKATIDEKITLRIEYIEFLKKKYRMTWN
ncbi:hypothetical protein [Flavobacterium sp. M31R6]|uniref:hypothetical protein n=1 Tax=Flavobacterium sp. M31R6 TaxID=2739062 RepID=UPI001568A6DE|nr:hypothetical protein [Flavobacterium sp. M31R6]QKJ63772.1 hypothetical protein HQN62_11755 [Flavobacterium sp. M31R6]